MPPTTVSFPPPREAGFPSPIRHEARLEDKEDSDSVLHIFSRIPPLGLLFLTQHAKCTSSHIPIKYSSECKSECKKSSGTLCTNQAGGRGFECYPRVLVRPRTFRCPNRLATLPTSGPLYYDYVCMYHSLRMRLACEWSVSCYYTHGRFLAGCSRLVGTRQLYYD